MYSVDRRSRAHRSSMMRDIASGLCPKKDMNSLRAMNSSWQASRATAVAVRPLPSSRAISPKNSPGPRTLRISSLPCGVHGEGDAARQDAVEAVAGIALLEEDMSSRNTPATRALQQLLPSCADKRGEERMEAEQVLWRHSSGTVALACRQSGQLRQPAQDVGCGAGRHCGGTARAIMMACAHCNGASLCKFSAILAGCSCETSLCLGRENRSGNR